MIDCSGRKRLERGFLCRQTYAKTYSISEAFLNVKMEQELVVNTMLFSCFTI